MRLCELYHLIFDALFALYSSVLHNDEKTLFFFFVKPVLVIPVPAIVGVFESIWSDVKLVGFCLCNVSMVRLYFMFSEYCGVSVHGESPSFEIEVH